MSTGDLDDGPEIDAVAAIADRIGYGRVIQAMHARWALLLKKQYPDWSWQTCARGALWRPTDVNRLAKLNDHDAERHVRWAAGLDLV